jgi:hypothetical protein
MMRKIMKGTDGYLHREITSEPHLGCGYVFSEDVAKETNKGQGEGYNTLWLKKSLLRFIKILKIKMPMISNLLC